MNTYILTRPHTIDNTRNDASTGHFFLELIFSTLPRNKFWLAQREHDPAFPNHVETLCFFHDDRQASCGYSECHQPIHWLSASNVLFCSIVTKHPPSSLDGLKRTPSPVFSSIEYAYRNVQHCHRTALSNRTTIISYNDGGTYCSCWGQMSRSWIKEICHTVTILFFFFFFEYKNDDIWAKKQCSSVIRIRAKHLVCMFNYTSIVYSSYKHALSRCTAQGPSCCKPASRAAAPQYFASSCTRCSLSTGARNRKPACTISARVHTQPCEEYCFR